MQIAPDSSKLAVVMVGLPARGKSYTARRIERYLDELGERIRDVREGPDGAIYLLTDSPRGRLLRLEPTSR